MARSRALEVAGGIALAGIAGALGAAALARRRGISLGAWSALKVAPLLGRTMRSESRLTRAIAVNQAAGAARLPRRLRDRLTFSEERRGDDVVFDAAQIAGATTPLRLLYLHGGAFVFEFVSMQWRLVAGLIERTGAGVTIPIYPLAPDHDWQAGQAMVRRAYDALAAEFGAANVVVVGDSAGGGLALSLVQSLKQDGAALPKALVLFSPWLDLGGIGADQPDLERRDPALTIDGLRACGRMWAREVPLDDPRVSPLFGDVADLPPTLVFSGGRDVLDSDARRLVAANPAVRLEAHPEMFHDWVLAPIPEGRAALDTAGAFIREVTGG